MKNPLLNKLRPFPLLITVALLALVSFFVFTIVGILGAILLYDTTLADILNQISPDNMTNIGILKVMQIFQSIGIFIVPALIIAWMASKSPYSYLGFGKPWNWFSFVLMILLLLSAEPVVAYSGVLNEMLALPDFMSGIEDWMLNMEEKAMDLTEAFLNVTTIGGLSVNLLMIALIPGIGEELFFRGLLQPLFHKWFKNIHVAVIVTSLLFSALHMQFYGFLPRFLLGVLFGYIFVWTKNLWLPILAHIIHNAIPVFGYYLYATEKSSTNMDEVGTGANIWIWAIAGLVFVAIFAQQLIQNQKKLTDHKYLK